MKSSLGTHMRRLPVKVSLHQNTTLASNYLALIKIHTAKLSIEFSLQSCGNLNKCIHSLFSVQSLPLFLFNQGCKTTPQLIVFYKTQIFLCNSNSLLVAFGCSTVIFYYLLSVNSKSFPSIQVLNGFYSLYHFFFTSEKLGLSLSNVFYLNFLRIQNFAFLNSLLNVISRIVKGLV